MVYNNTPEFALNGVLRNPLASTTVLKSVCAEVRRRLEADELSDSMKAKLVHALTAVKERLEA